MRYVYLRKGRDFNQYKLTTRARWAYYGTYDFQRFVKIIQDSYPDRKLKLVP